MGFAERLKELRAKSKLSQEGLARRAGLAVSSIVKYECGLCSPSFANAIKLAKALDITPNELAGSQREAVTA